MVCYPQACIADCAGLKLGTGWRLLSDAPHGPLFLPLQLFPLPVGPCHSMRRRHIQLAMLFFIPGRAAIEGFHNT